LSTLKKRNKKTWEGTSKDLIAREELLLASKSYYPLAPRLVGKKNPLENFQGFLSRDKLCPPDQAIANWVQRHAGTPSG